MVSFDNITLCCVDTSHHVLSAAALKRCNDAGKFAKTVFITDRPEYADDEWEAHRINTFANYEDFNRFMLKGLYYHINTDYVLIVQFDGFIINVDSWANDFLQYDYIGAPWPGYPREYAVGNGGFSLRSRKLLKALQDDRIFAPPGSVAEDVCICSYRSYLERHHDIRIAPLEVAQRFSYEDGPFVDKTFGFHGFKWLGDLYAGEAAFTMIDNLQPYIIRSSKTLEMALQYVQKGRNAEAERLFQRIAECLTPVEADAILARHSASAGFLDLFHSSWQRFVVDGHRRESSAA